MAGTLKLDIHCAKCGYNLRTMPVHGRCPECTGPVIPSIELAMEGYWAKELPRAVRGLKLLGWTNWAAIVLVSVSSAISEMETNVVWRISLVLIACVILAHAWGAWILTRASPGRRQTFDEIGVRICAAVIAFGLIDYLGFLMGTRWLIFEPLRHFVWFAILVTPIVYVYLTGRRLKIICLSVGEQSVARWSRWTTVMFSIGYFLLISAGLLYEIRGRMLIPEHMAILDWITSLAGGIGLLLTVPLYFIITVLLLMVGHRLTVAYRREGHWI